MNTSKRIVVTILLSVFLATFAQAEDSKKNLEAKTNVKVKNASHITFVTDPWCPYVCDEKKNGRRGYVIDMAQEIFGKNGQNVVTLFVPWSRAQLDVSKNKYEGLPGATAMEKKKFKYNIPEEFFAMQGSSFFVKKGNAWRFDMKNAEKAIVALPGKIGLVQDYEYALMPLFAKHKKSESVSGEFPLEKLIQMLNAGRIDAIIEDANVVNFTVAEMKKAGKLPSDFDVEFAGRAEEPIPMTVAFCSNERCKKLAEEYSEGMKVLKKTGRFKAILESYGLKEF